MIILFAMHNTLQGIRDPLKRRQKEKTYILEVCELFILLAAIRYLIPTGDAWGYAEEYRSVLGKSFKDVFEEREISYVYYLLSKLFSLTRLPYHFWFAFVEFFFLSAYVRIVNKFSVDKMLSLFLFYTIGLYDFSFHGLKQIVAMALIWHGFVDSYEKKNWRSAALVFLAYYCHKTSMVFLIAYILPFLERFKRIYYFLIVIVSATLVISYSSVLTQLTDIIGDERYALYFESEQGYTASLFIFYLILFGIAFFANKQKDDSKNNRIIIGLAVMTVFCQLFAFRVASAFRLSLFFLPFLIMYISNQLKYKRDLQYLMFFLCAFWLLYTTQFPYKFFWQ